MRSPELPVMMIDRCTNIPPIVLPDAPQLTPNKINPPGTLSIENYIIIRIQRAITPIPDEERRLDQVLGEHIANPIR